MMPRPSLTPSSGSHCSSKCLTTALEACTAQFPASAPASPLPSPRPHEPWFPAFLLPQGLCTGFPPAGMLFSSSSLSPHPYSLITSAKHHFSRAAFSDPPPAVRFLSSPSSLAVIIALFTQPGDEIVSPLPGRRLHERWALVHYILSWPWDSAQKYF